MLPNPSELVNTVLQVLESVMRGKTQQILPKVSEAKLLKHSLTTVMEWPPLTMFKIRWARASKSQSRCFTPRQWLLQTLLSTMRSATLKCTRQLRSASKPVQVSLHFRSIHCSQWAISPKKTKGTTRLRRLCASQSLRSLEWWPFRALKAVATSYLRSINAKFWPRKLRPSDLEGAR